MLDFAFTWFDLIWIPCVFIFAARRHWVTALIFVLLAIASLRLQVELMNDIGYPTGFLPLLSTPALWRGFFVYGFFIFVFLLLSFFSKRENAYVYIAAAIGMFIIAFCLSMGLMFL